MLKMSAMMDRLGWMYSYAQRELTWGAGALYGVIFLLSWLFSKLLIFPYLSPLRKMPRRPVPWSLLLMGQMPEILRKEAIDPYIEWVKEMKTGIICYRHNLGSLRVMVADSDAVKDVLVTNAAYYVRPDALFRMFSRITGLALLTLEGQEHRVQRRLCSGAFKQSSVQALVPTFQKQGQLLCDKWSAAIKAAGEDSVVADIQTAVSNMTFDIINEAGFGYQTNVLSDPEEKVSAAFNTLLTGGNRLVRSMIPNLYNKLPLEANKKFQSSLQYLHSLIHSVIGKKEKALEEEKSDKPSSMDLLEMLMTASDVETGEGLSLKQLQDHVITFMLAGHETTASTVAWALLCMANHPDLQSKVRQEVMSHLPPSGQPITTDDLDRLTYLGCFVKETLRLYPPAPVVMRQATQDMVLGGYNIPKGTIINISVGALHRNPAYWDDPEEFKPERFADESNIPVYTFQPFISGPHMCIGYRFALQEAKVTLALLLKHFEFSTLPGMTYSKKQFFTLRPFPTLKLKVQRVA